jgi:glycosyltransferase involved in cell wall biosynthesis
MSRLSIITINLNNAEGLKKTIESVISQTSKDFEYIIIDGASTDGSKEVIEKYADKITYWVSEKDKGLYNAQNKGLLKASGDYCQFLNSGDCLVKNDVVEKMLDKLPAGCSIFYGNMLKKLKTGKIYRDRGPSRKISMLTFYRATINHSSAFIKRSLFEKYGLYDESLKIVADWKFYLIAVGINNETVQHINIDVSLFDMSGISNVNTELDKAERRKVLENYLLPHVLADYDCYWRDIECMNRLKRYSLTRGLVWLTERFLFNWEKLIH